VVVAPIVNAVVEAAAIKIKIEIPYMYEAIKIKIPYMYEG